jgi:hypothetical protein
MRASFDRPKDLLMIPLGEDVTSYFDHSKTTVIIAFASYNLIEMLWSQFENRALFIAAYQ